MRTDESSLGATIKAARIKRGFTQEFLSEKVGVGLRHYMSIENEGRHPSYRLLYEIIRALNIPADSIFYPERQTNAEATADLANMISRCDGRSLAIIRATVQAALDSQPDI